MSLKYDVLKRPLELKKTYDHCAVKNPKLTVVFIHGIAADSSSFARALDYLEGTTSLKAVRFVAFDLLGAGKSYKSDKLEYNYNEQVEALHNAILRLKLDTPLVLVGHSLGTLIVTRYADTYKKSVKHLILISPPIYTEEDLDNPDFAAAMEVFRDTVRAKNRQMARGKQFEGSMKNIVLDRKNYRVLCELKTRATLIYGGEDQIIAPYNIPKALKANPKYLTAIKTEGRHSVSRDKYSKMVGVLEEVLNA